MLLRSEGFSFFINNMNLAYIFNSAECIAHIMKHVSTNVERWDIRIYGFRYEAINISGEENVWADLLSRWGSHNQPKPTRGSINPIFQAPHVPDLYKYFNWPGISNIAELQY